MAGAHDSCATRPSHAQCGAGSSGRQRSTRARLLWRRAFGGRAKRSTKPVPSPAGQPAFEQRALRARLHRTACTRTVDKGIANFEKLKAGTRVRNVRTDGKSARVGVKCGTKFD